MLTRIAREVVLMLQALAEGWPGLLLLVLFVITAYIGGTQ